MKTISVHISDESIASDAINELYLKIKSSTKQTSEFQIFFNQVEYCINNFVEKAEKLTRTGTTIHIEKQFTLSDIKILITLDYPKKISFMNKLKNFFINN